MKVSDEKNTQSEKNIMTIKYQVPGAVSLPTTFPQTGRQVWGTERYLEAG